MVETEYTSGFGDRWVLRIDVDNRTGVLRGSDVDWEEYPVVEGCAFELLLDSDETRWVRTSWDAAFGSLPDPGWYGGLDAEFRSQAIGCFLTGSHCPICLRKKRELEPHHCIWAYDGGADDYRNLLLICKTCHAILTSGATEDRVPRDSACFYHQLGRFGLDLIPRAPRAEKRHEGRSFLAHHPHWQATLAAYDQMIGEDRLRGQNMVKRMGFTRYLYFRDMSLGKWSWEDYVRRNRCKDDVLIP